MRWLLRTAWAQATLAFLLSLYIGFTLATLRWRIENRGPIEAAAESSEGFIGCFWHGRIALGVICKRVLKSKPRRVLISQSRDGAFIARAVERLGYPAIRGSAAQGTRTKGAVSAFRQALRFLRDGGVLAITPDGPRGPHQVMPAGPVQMARAAGVPIFLAGLACRPGLTLASWDKTRLPLPFGRGCMVLDGPIRAAHDLDEAEVEAARQDLQDRLTAAQARAEAILAGRAGD